MISCERARKRAKKITHNLTSNFGYSKHIKTYCSCFLKFMDSDKSIDLLSKEDIKTFLLYLIQHRKVSPSTQNKYINAIKFYYKKVLKQPKMVWKDLIYRKY